MTVGVLMTRPGQQPVRLVAPDGQLQAVLDAAWREFGDPNGSTFPPDVQALSIVPERKRGRR